MRLDGYTKDFIQQLKITLIQVHSKDRFHCSLTKNLPHFYWLLRFARLSHLCGDEIWYWSPPVEYWSFRISTYQQHKHRLISWYYLLISRLVLHAISHRIQRLSILCWLYHDSDAKSTRGWCWAHPCFWWKTEQFKGTTCGTNWNNIMTYSLKSLLLLPLHLVHAHQGLVR